MPPENNLLKVEVITAIIPNYNHASFLVRRLQSVYGQTYPHLRVILLDDASTDNSRAILETWRHHPRTQAIVYNEANSGSPFVQWQKGLELAQTDWVWIAESDDWCHTGFLESLRPGLETKDCVLAYAGLYWSQPDGSVIKEANPGDRGGWFDGKDFVRQHLFGWNRLQNAGMAVFRRQMALQAPAGWQALRQAGDYRLWAAIARQGRVYGCGQRLCYMTKHPASVTANRYHTPEAQQERADTWWAMYQQGDIARTDWRRQVERELIQLTLRRGHVPAGYLQKWQAFWTGQLGRAGYRPRPLFWRWAAIRIKARHWLRKQRT